MRLNTRFLTLVVAVFFLALPAARADEASKRGKVEQLFVLTRVDAMMGQMVGQVSAAMKKGADEQARKQGLTPEQQVFADKFAAKVDGILRQSLSMDTLKPIFIKVYMDTYTEEELDGIVAFYESSAGKAFIAKSPQLMQNTMRLMQQQVADVQPQIEQAQKELLDELAHSQGTSQPKPQAKPKP